MLDVQSSQCKSGKDAVKWNLYHIKVDEGIDLWVGAHTHIQQESSYTELMTKWSVIDITQFRVAIFLCGNQSNGWIFLYIFIISNHL